MWHRFIHFGFGKEKNAVEMLMLSSNLFTAKKSTIGQIQNAGIEMMQYIYKVRGTPLSTWRVHCFKNQSKVG